MNQATTRYTKTSVVLHWLIAIGIFIMFGIGWFMADLPKDVPKQTVFDLFDLGIFHWSVAEEISPRNFYFNLHKSIGFTLFWLIIIRILWRFTHKPPAMLTSYKEMERKLARGAHFLLYALMFALPFSGIKTALYSKYGVKWFGIPLISGTDDKVTRDFWVNAHEIIGLILVAIIVLHILGALKHKFIDKDETLSRMSLK
jgi:cytochrome b561